MTCDLSAQFTTNGTAATSDKYHLAFNTVQNLRQINLDRLSAEQILHGNVLHPAQGNLTGKELVHTGQDLHFTARLFTDIKDIPCLLPCGARDGKEDRIDLILVNCGQNIFSSAEDGNSLNVAVPFIRIVIDKTANLIFYLIGMENIPQQNLTGLTCTDDHDMLHIVRSASLTPLKQHKSIEESYCRRQHELDQDAKKVIGKGHLSEDQCNADHLRQKCHSVGAKKAY